MGFLDKFFGTKAAEENAAENKAKTFLAEPQAVDFGAALTMQVRNEVDEALAAYLAIEAGAPEDALAPFFAAAIIAGRGSVAEAAEKLRGLSGRIAAAGNNISQVISREVVDVIDDSKILRYPAVAEVVVSFGDQLKKERFLQESAVCFEIASGLVPDNAHVLHKFGDTLHDLRLYEYAETVLKEAVKLAPNHWGALYTYAVLLQDLGRIGEAIQHYERAVQLIPDHPNSRNNYGAALMIAGRLDEALVQCTLAAELSPAAPMVKVNLGNIHLLKQEYEAARTFLNEAISLNDNLPQAYFGLASIEQALGHPAKSCELYRKAIERNPSVAEFHYALAKLLAGEGDEQALTHFSTAVQLKPGLKNLHRDFGAACLSRGLREEALEYLKTALQQDADDAVAQELLARAQEGATE